MEQTQLSEGEMPLLLLCLAELLRTGNFVAADWLLPPTISPLILTFGRRSRGHCEARWGVVKD